MNDRTYRINDEPATVGTSRFGLVRIPGEPTDLPVELAAVYSNFDEVVGTYLAELTPIETLRCMAENGRHGCDHPEHQTTYRWHDLPPTMGCTWDEDKARELQAKYGGKLHRLTLTIDEVD